MENLEFCTLAYNTQHAFANGLIPITARTFKVTLLDDYNNAFVLFVYGTMKDISKRLNVPLGTLYDIFYKNNKSLKYRIVSIEVAYWRSRD